MFFISLSKEEESQHHQTAFVTYILPLTDCYVNGQLLSKAKFCTLDSVCSHLLKNAAPAILYLSEYISVYFSQ